MRNQALTQSQLAAFLSGFTFLLMIAGCDSESSLPSKYPVIIGEDTVVPSLNEMRNLEEERRRQNRLIEVSAKTSKPLEPIPAVEDLTVAETAARALSYMGAAAVPELRRALFDPRIAVRIRAADVLADIGPEAKEAAPDLMRVLGDPNPELKKAAIRALGAIGPAAEKAAPTLVKLLENDA